MILYHVSYNSYSPCQTVSEERGDCEKSSGLSDGILKWTRWGSQWVQQVQQTEEQPPYKF